jgi:hypothetical protein
MLSLTIVGAAILSARATAADPTDPLAKSPTWAAPRAQEVRAEALKWLEEKKPDEATKAKAAALWSALPQQTGEADLLAALAGTVALADENAAKLVALCAKPKDQLILPPQPWLSDAKTPPLVTHNLRLLYGRWLMHAELFDEALEQLSGLNPCDVAAPATLLFYQGVAYHTLLDKEAGLKTIAQLLEGPEGTPRRYVALARLMQEDLKSLQDDSLDHIARRMSDVRRRLDLGRGGKKVRGIEDGIIESLDKIIKKLEEKQKQSSGSAGGIQDNFRSSRPAPDSLPIGGKGPGEVTKRNIGSADDWGNLPPKEREEALQKIGRDFPSHYRDVIEQYFRRLAAEGSEEK